MWNPFPLDVGRTSPISTKVVSKNSVPGQEQKSGATVIVAVGNDPRKAPRPVGRPLRKTFSSLSPRELMDDKQQRRASELKQPLAPPPPDAGMSDAALAADTQNYKAYQKTITKGLRKFFDAVAAEPVPDEFMDLLRKMDESGHDR
jgi:Anti-sigma factor NepR